MVVKNHAVKTGYIFNIKLQLRSYITAHNPKLTNSFRIRYIILYILFNATNDFISRHVQYIKVSVYIFCMLY